MRTPLLVCAGLVVVVSSSCSPIEGLCQKEYDCRDELGIPFEDDYPAVCKAAGEGAQAALRANAEQQCEDLANAELALAACLQVLSCEDFANFRSGNSGEHCKDLLDDRNAKAEAAGARCDAIGEAGGGEGEGEGA
jgi:hypothetical protein